MRRGRAWKKRARRTATASLPLWARIPRFYIWNNELERAKDAICERPLNLYVCRRGALWLAYHRTQTQSATQWEFVFNPSTDIDSDYSYDSLLVFGKSALSVPDTRFSRVSGSTQYLAYVICAEPIIFFVCEWFIICQKFDNLRVVTFNDIYIYIYILYIYCIYTVFRAIFTKQGKLA